MVTCSVEITSSGRGGSIRYREADGTVAFDWEFALPPVLALIFGPAAAHWDARVPWAVGRQAEIFDHVAREVVRQQTYGARYAIDLRSGTIQIIGDASDIDTAEATPSAARGIVPAAPPERDPWEALRDHLSIDVRLAAAEKLHRADAAFDIESVLVREIRNLHRSADGLERALRLAQRHDSPRVRQALLWASWNRTECAPPCATLLLRLTGAAAASGEADDARIAERLGPHFNSYERTDAFAELCRSTGMERDASAT